MSHVVIDDFMLRCIVTAVLIVSIAGYVYGLVAQHSRWVYTVKHLLHLAMSVVMIMMAWSIGTTVPTVAPIAVFLLAAAWFVLVPARMSCGSGRLTDGYHAVGMTAMAWMYAVMDGSVPGQMGRTDLAGPEASWTAPEPGWIGAVNGAAAAGFAVATLWWLFRYFTERSTGPVSRNVQLAHIGWCCQASTAAGAAIMFAVLM